MLQPYIERECWPKLGSKSTLATGTKLGPFESAELVGKRLIFTSKWTTAWHHGVRDASLNAHLQSFHSPIAVEEQPSLETPTGHNGDRMS